ncbi:MAG TPA: Uma2 family endonuclease [Anaerolineae bacterium]|nr:Uma2 family endonuclease [Anaerolineae bacterium]
MEKIITFEPSMPAKPDIYYPESDGQPIGETEFHINAILHLLQSLRYFFRQTEGVYVAADMLFYYEEGNPSAFKVPDVFVVKGVSKQRRRTYKLWQERVAPCAVFEITSASTWLEDLGGKRALYEKLGVPEYFLFDPLDEYLSPRLQGFRLVNNYYQPVTLSATGTLSSQELGVILQPEGELLRIVDPVNNETVPTLDEAVKRAETEAERAQTEADRARTEAERAQTEAKRADTAEAELQRLRAELDRLRRQSDEG